MNTKYIFILFMALLCGVQLIAQTRVIPGPPQDGGILMIGGVAHLGNGQVIQNAAIGFDQGKITLVEDAAKATIDRSQYKEVIELNGQHVYPGFILPCAEIGLVEVSSIGDTDDSEEQGQFNPNVRSIIAYNTDSELIPTLRFNGILMAQSTPSSGVISGASTVVQLDAWNWEDAAYYTDDAIHLYWPRKMRGARWWLGETQARINPNYEKRVKAIKDFFVDAAAYGQMEAPEDLNLKLEAMQGLFDGTKSLFIHTNKARGMVAGVNTAKKHGVQRIVIAGGHEAMLVRDFIVENKIPIVLNDIHRTPSRDHEDTVYPYKLPKELHDAGIEFCLGYFGSLGSTRNLPFYAGTTVAWGMEYEEALKTITSNAANILGIGDRVGTLEKGKDATLFISTGDAFDMRTNNVEQAFIQGRKIQINARQQFLYEKYSEKYGHSRE